MRTVPGRLELALARVLKLVKLHLGSLANGRAGRGAG